MHVMRVSWRAKGSDTYLSGIQVWLHEKERPEFFQLHEGTDIAWTISGPRRCIGTIDVDGLAHRCPENSLVRRGMRRCGPCSALDEMDPCIRCVGQDCVASETRKEHCLTTDYVVYLAVFNDETLKVGVSTKKRMLTRWVEQGADFAGVIGEVRGGLEARRVEKVLGSSPLVKKQVRAKRKALHLLTPISSENAHSLAQRFLSSVTLPEIQHDISLFDLSDYYNLSSLSAKPQSWRSGRTPVEGLQLVGDVVGMKGPLLLTRIASAFTVANLSGIIGYRIDDESDIIMHSQSGLLDYL